MAASKKKKIVSNIGSYEDQSPVLRREATLQIARNSDKSAN